MKHVEQSRHSFSMLGIEGVFFALSPFAFVFIGSTNPPVWPAAVLWGIAAIALTAHVAGALLIYRTKSVGKILCCSGLTGTLVVAQPFLSGNPAAALLAVVVAIGAFFGIIDLRVHDHRRRKDDHIVRSTRRVRWAAFGSLFIAVFISLFTIKITAMVKSVVVVSTCITLLFLVLWGIKKGTMLRLLLPLCGCLLLGVLFAFTGTLKVGIPLLINGIAALLTINRMTLVQQEKWWMYLINHPARLMLTTFLLLCIGGAFLLTLPFATTAGTIDPVNAAFTATSAVCVTGLTVLDTAKDFTIAGQVCILVLIQLGGLGIMSITTVALHAFGRRMSLQQEQVMISLTDTDHQELFDALKQVILFTLIVEGVGGLLLTGQFIFAGEDVLQALWSGVFTAISAFCNAGFALQSDNLLPYMKNPLVLQTIGLLIVLGGIAPATNFLIPRWIRKKQIPLSSYLALVTTVLLIFSGMLFFLAFEWNGILNGLSIVDKVSNALFQSITLRTAGFNSVPLDAISTPSFLFMNLFMLIGGSPGGTAGGIKTTTFGVLVLTFFTTIANRKEILLKNKRIPPQTIYRAIAICFSGAIVWSCAVLMLTITQQVSARDLIFEVSSAMGTVGLSIGATVHLDEIGKTIIMLVMFAGRVGPMTLFMLFGRGRPSVESQCPEAKITLA